MSNTETIDYTHGEYRTYTRSGATKNQVNAVVGHDVRGIPSVVVYLEAFELMLTDLGFERTA